MTTSQPAKPKRRRNRSAQYWFWQAYRRSLIIQGLVTLILVVVVAILYLSTAEVPDGLLTLLGVVMGYWFKTKTDTN